LTEGTHIKYRTAAHNLKFVYLSVPINDRNSKLEGKRIAASSAAFLRFGRTRNTDIHIKHPFTNLHQPPLLQSRTGIVMVPYTYLAMTLTIRKMRESGRAHFFAHQIFFQSCGAGARTGAGAGAARPGAGACWGTVSPAAAVANTHQSKNQTNHGGVRSTASWRLEAVGTYDRLNVYHRRPLMRV
jgi:hypothetical protein